MKLNLDKLTPWFEVAISIAFLAASTWVLLSIVSTAPPVATLVLAFSIHTMICVVGSTELLSVLRRARAHSDGADHDSDSETLDRGEVEDLLAFALDREDRLWRARIIMSNILIANHTLNDLPNPCHDNIKLATQHTQAHEQVVREHLESEGDCTCPGCVAKGMVDVIALWEPEQLGLDNG